MNTLFVWTGAFVWGVVSFVVAWLIAEWFVGVVNAVSLTRWYLRAREDTFRWREHWWWPIWHVAKEASTTLYAYRNRGNLSITCQKTGRVWRGIGDWT